MQTPGPLPAEGIDIPVRQNSATPTGLAFWALKRNTLNPRLTLFPDRLVYNILAETRLPLEDIERVDVSRALGGHALRVRCAGSSLDYTGLTRSDSDLIRLLGLLQGRVPLTERARFFAAEGRLPEGLPAELRSAGVVMLATGAFNLLIGGSLVMALLGGGAFVLTGSSWGWLCGAPGLLLWPLGLAEIVAGVMALNGTRRALEIMARVQLVGVLGLSLPSLLCSVRVRRALRRC